MIDPKKHGTDGKEFIHKDAVPDMHTQSYGFDARICCNREDLIYNPPQWLRRGLQETRTGYGSRLNSGYSIRYEGRVYRVYVSQFSNNGTSWFRAAGQKIIVNAH